jgi:hypothetical protein
MSHARFLEAAQRILDGDDSAAAANDLKAVVLDDYPDDEQYDDLVDVLTRYAADQHDPGTVTEEVRTVIRETIARVM